MRGPRRIHDLERILHAAVAQPDTLPGVSDAAPRRPDRERGEFIDAQALSPEGTYVRYGGPGAAPVTTDGPFPETKELAAGWFLVNVDSEARAYEIAAYVSSAPGKDGQPIYEWIEVRPVMDDAPATAE